MHYGQRTVRAIAEASGQHVIIESINANGRTFRSTVKWISLSTLRDQIFRAMTMQPTHARRSLSLSTGRPHDPGRAGAVTGRRRLQTPVDLPPVVRLRSIDGKI
ncbi:hypothetical protein [Paraburkholderia sp. BL10I2N1]|uniref:hypothetical protein n=1 Tax=Paraburkholderia sp. BL10I2N1 TaxID=1938796 RepID=UPI001061641C|nr:hypothetical protein [Paraburkholderia sp. BL10I2N1]